MLGEYIHYDEHEVKRMPFKHPREIVKVPGGLHWVHIPLNEEALRGDGAKDIQRAFDLDRLTWEDITKGDHLPKAEVDDHRIFVVMQVLSFDVANQKISKNQVSILIQNNLLLTFLHGEQEVFEVVIDKLKANRNDMRSRGLDYLLYSVVGAVVNLHFDIFKSIEMKMDDIEAQVIRQSKSNAVHDLYKMRKEIMKVRSAVNPIKDMVRILLYESRFIQESNRAVFMDIGDRVVEINESLAYYRELVNALYDMNLSSASNRMNRIMTTLTIYSAIFIPLTFLAGVYGMNFKYMPELDLVWGYPAFLGLCLIIGLSMLAFFKRKRWI